MMLQRIFVGAAMAAILFSGCGGSRREAPAGPDGRPIPVLIQLDRGVPGRARLPGEVPREATAEERSAFATWMESDLAALLGKAGYRVSLLPPDSQAAAGTDGCRLAIVLRSYVPANRASRTEAGLGEGVVSVEIGYELFRSRGGSERRLFSNSRSMSTGRNWEWLAHALNEKVVQEVSRRLAELRGSD